MGDVIGKVAKNVRDFYQEGKNPGRIAVELEIDTDTYDFGDYIPSANRLAPEDMTDEEKVRRIEEDVRLEIYEISHATTESGQDFIIFEEGLMETWEVNAIAPFVDAVKERMKKLGINEAVVWLDE